MSKAWLDYPHRSLPTGDILWFNSMILWSLCCTLPQVSLCLEIANNQMDTLRFSIHRIPQKTKNLMRSCITVHQKQQIFQLRRLESCRKYCFWSHAIYWVGCLLHGPYFLSCLLPPPDTVEPLMWGAACWKEPQGAATDVLNAHLCDNKQRQYSVRKGGFVVMWFTHGPDNQSSP